MIEVRRASLSLSGRPILKEIDLAVRTGEALGLVGPNGSGKSTLLKTLLGSLKPDSGDVLLDGRPLSGIRRRRIAQQIALVSQERPSSGGQTAFEAVALGALPRRHWLSGVSREDRRSVDEALRRVGLAHMRDRRLDALSGGERQRALIARALMQRASHLLMDEPTNHLDLHHQFDVLETVRSTGCTAVLVLHDLNLAARYCDRIALIDDGRIVKLGSPAEVLKPQLISDVYNVLATPLSAPKDHYHLHFDHAGDRHHEQQFK